MLLLQHYNYSEVVNGETVELLLKHVSGSAYLLEELNTALHQATSSGHAEAVPCLLNHRADVSHTDGTTLAIELGDVTMLKLLLTELANPE
ncbi:hypothetical protein TcWFU_001980 [Taenia crassiceps]|uniref:ANK_REP_REGION domain-containing protein n=1 Tax=Taenia crassiceps TaxID=6207 RepID=A0ABR4Q4P0_9CEST